MVAFGVIVPEKVGQADIDTGGGAAIARVVEPRAAEGAVGARPALDHVVALETDEIVVAAPPEDLVDTVGAVDVVGGIAAGELGHFVSPLGSAQVA